MKPVSEIWTIDLSPFQIINTAFLMPGVSCKFDAEL